MESIKDVLNGMKSGPLSTTYTTQAGSTSWNYDLINLINMIFKRFQNIYAHKYLSAFGDATEIKMVKKEWYYSDAFKSLSQAQVELGINKCIDGTTVNEKGESWPPNLPEFIKLCQDEPAEEKYHLPYFKHEDRSRSIRKEDAIKLAELKLMLGCEG